MGVDVIKRCTMGGCASADFNDCRHCGFYPTEAARIKKLPLVLCKDGLRRKIIRRKKNDVEDG